MSAVALSNNDVVFLAWQVDTKIPDCLGFAIYRKDASEMSKGEQGVPLPAWVGFQGDSNPKWKPKTTETWPVQKFTWRDLTAHSGETYVYHIVPMVGTPGHLKPAPKMAQTTDPVTVTPERGDVSAYFNRGILSTQFLTHQLPHGTSGLPNYSRLKGRIDQPGDPLRNRLSGQLREAMLGLFDRAEKEKGQLYLALYELTDTELEQRLLSAKAYAHVILSNTGVDDAENQPAREALHEAGLDVLDRMVSSGHIGHNKFAVYVGPDRKPKAVWSGSTNWTDTGLCAQSNNGLLIESPELAKVYLDYWKRIKEDDSGQGADFRKENDQEHHLKANGQASDFTVWFSPNTRQKSKPKEPATPHDMEAVFEAMDQAEQAILFLVFQPGDPSVVDKAVEIQNSKPNLFIHGAATDPKAVDDYATHLFHRSGSPESIDVVAAAAIQDQFGYWEKELLKSSPSAHAIIHDKVVVIDPFSDNCVVITGSHNLGYRASYCNDENLLLIRGNRALAEAYATHVMDVYDHYRWRYILQQKKNRAWTGLQAKDTWQDKYFASDSPSRREIEFWMGAANPIGAKAASKSSQRKPRT